MSAPQAQSGFFQDARAEQDVETVITSYSIHYTKLYEEKLGKIFNALEKYKKERKAIGRPGRLKPVDYEALLQYDFECPQVSPFTPRTCRYVPARLPSVPVPVIPRR